MKLLILVLLASQNLFALSSAPSFALIFSTTDDSSLSMACKGDAPYKKIYCSFTQARISKKTDVQIQSEVNELKKAKEEDLKQSMNYCKDLPNLRKEANAKATSPNKILKLAEEISFFASMCSCKSDIKCIVEKFSKKIEQDRDLCKISVHTFELEFDRVNENKWISNPGPKGICNMVNVAIIEKDLKSDILWSFSQTRVSGDIDKDFCKGFELNKPTLYTWRAESESKVKCESVKFDVI